MKFEDIPQFTREGSYQVDMPLIYFAEYIDKEVEKMGLQLNPPFQRGHVWTKEQQTAFVEYFLKGGRSGLIIYFNHPAWQSWTKKRTYKDYVCVDGLQRITALICFLHNEIPAFEHYYQDYEDREGADLSHVMKININNLQTEKEVLQWYIEMNTGGTVHTKEEIQKVQDMLQTIENKENNEHVHKLVLEKDESERG